jgi:two-component system chemotaxis sensor kinase CheA
MSSDRLENNASTAPVLNSLAADPELLSEFLMEAREHLTNIENQALALEQNPQNTEAIHGIFRAFHTIKGLAGFLDLGPMQAVAHAVETVLDLARNGQLELTPAVIDGILESKDFLLVCTSALDGAVGITAWPAGSELLIERMDALGSGSAAVMDVPENGSLPEGASNEALLPLEEMESASAAAGLEDLARAVAGDAEPAPQPPPAAGEARPQGARRKDIAFVKVQTTKLDYLVDMMGEMVITQSLIRHDPDLSLESKPRLGRNISQLARITDEVQRTAMSMRMVPLAQLFNKMSRLVRDLAQKSGKTVELVLEGEDTELDRNIVEELGDPLMHMVRNALDHGIEAPVERLEAGKSATARVLLKAGHQSGHIVIEISDDGRGLNRDKILRKAIQRGLAAPNATLTDNEVFNFIFHPGFSTAEKITDVSGRGVGMDVVRKHIQKLRGRVEIQSALGRGTTFQLKLPLTLAIIDALVAGVGTERYIVPIYIVREMLRPTPDMISTVQGKAEMALVRGSLLPLVRLHECFGVTPRSTDPCECLLIVAESGEKRFCLMVDELIGKQEVVIKSLGEKFEHVEGVAGGAILGDGRVGLILDLERLFGKGRSE